MNRHEDDEIDLRELLRTLLKGKKIIVFFVLAAVAAAIAYTYYSRRQIGEARAVISYNYEGVDKGLEPSGGQLDVEQIKAPAILDRVILDMELHEKGISVDNLRRNIDVTPIIPEFIVERIRRARQDGQDYSYFPNEYLVKFGIRRSLGISREEGKRILDSIITAYIDYFKRHYSDEAVFSNALRGVDLYSYDYPEVSMALNNQIDIIINFLGDKKEEPMGPSFRSMETGLSFNDIIESLRLLRNVELNRMDALIASFNLTKDREQLLLSYEQRIRSTDLKRQKRKRESEIAVDMMDIFRKEQSTLLIPGIGMPGGIEMQMDSDYYGKLAEAATESGVEAERMALDIEYYREEMQRLRDDTVSDALKENAEKEVLTMIEDIEAKLTGIIKNTENTVEEYYRQKMGRAIMRLSPVEIYNNSRLKRNVILAFVLGLMLGVFFVFLRAFWKGEDSVSPPA